MQIRTLINEQALPELGFVASGLIKKFAKLNNLNFKLDIVYDYKLEDYGCYYPDDEPNKIFVNPSHCLENKEESIGYVDDKCLLGIILHEFAHFLMYRQYKSLITQYKLQFPTQRLVLNEYCNNCLEDEIADAMTLYFENPYLFSKIEPKYYNFFKKRFYSPSVNSTKFCYYFWDKFDSGMKKNILNKWGFTWDYATNKFIIKEE